MVSELAVENAKNIKTVILEGLDENIISHNEFIAMCADDKDPVRFYFNFKVHNAHAHNQPPQPRVGGGDNRASKQSSFTHVTTNT